MAQKGSSVGDVDVVVDKYRTFMYGEGEKDTQWRHGGPPTYDLVNQVFEEGRTKVCIDVNSYQTARLEIVRSKKKKKVVPSFVFFCPVMVFFWVTFVEWCDKCRNGRKGL